MSAAMLEEIRSKGRSFVLRVKGNALAHRAILDGDYLVVTTNPPTPGDQVVIRYLGDTADVRPWDPAEGAEVYGVMLALIRKPRKETVHA